MLFDTIHQNAKGCLRVARIENARGRVSVVYHDKGGRTRWKFELSDQLDTVSVGTTSDRETAQAVFNDLLQSIDPERKLPRPELPVWATSL